MAYNQEKKKFYKNKKRRDNKFVGLKVEVWNNNVELALKKLKKKVKNSGIMLQLRKKAYYEKPSKIRREKKNMAILRNKYKTLKENSNQWYLYTMKTKYIELPIIVVHPYSW